MHSNEMVALKDVNLKLGNFALSNINLDVKKGEHFVILGPSGNGKTVLAKSIAGLLHIDSGEIWIDGKRKDNLPPEDRGIGFVFQDHVLFPHMSVFDNIAFSLKIKKAKRIVIREKVENIAKALQITNLLNRSIENLSGGEKQRVALARSVIHKPDLLIMDEPYASMDKNMADELIIEEKKLQKQIKQTTIHITHNHEEAVTLADRICIMETGNIRMVGTPYEVFHKPKSSFVAKFLCTDNVYENAYLENGDKYSLVLYKNRKFYCKANGKKGRVALCIRSENVILNEEQPNMSRNVFKGKLVGLYDKGEMFRCVIDIGFELISKVAKRELLAMNISQGETVYARISEDSIHVI